MAGGRGNDQSRTAQRPRRGRAGDVEAKGRIYQRRALFARSHSANVPAAKLLRQLGLTRDNLMQALQQVRGSQRVTDQNPEGKYQTLEKYGRDLTEQARRGKIDPVIGRDNEIRRVMQILLRRTKNNPVLIGEPGRRQDRDRGRTGPPNHQW